MPTVLRQQAYPFGSLRKDPHWSVQGLVFYPQFRPTGKLIDESYYGNHGIITGTTWVRNVLDFSGANNWVNCGSDASLNITGDLTIIVKHKSLDSVFETLVGKQGKEGYWLATYATGAYQFFARGDTIANYSGDGAFASNIWTVCAVVHGGGNDTFYSDGVFFSSSANIGNPGSYPNNDFYIGIDPRDESGSDLSGQIEYILIYNRALSASEIAALYINPALPMQQPPIWLFKPPVVSAGMAGIYYRTLMQGVV